MSDYHTAYYAGCDIRFDVDANAAVDVGFCCEAMKMEEEEEERKKEDRMRAKRGGKSKEEGEGQGSLMQSVD